MRLAYIASHIFRHTFEINEAEGLLRLRPDTLVYSFHRPSGQNYQRQRIESMPCEIRTWSWSGIVRDTVRMFARHPLRVASSSVELGVRSLPNPIYWVKSIVIFMRGMTILADVERHGVDHIHASFGSSAATVAWLGKKILGTTYSTTYHAFEVYTRQVQYVDPLKREKLRAADLIVPVHDDARQVLSACVPDEDPDKFRVIRIAVDFQPQTRLDPLPLPPLVLAVGNLVDQKGFDVLVLAVAVLKRRGVDVRARILGEGPERPLLERLIKENGVTDRVELHGYFPHGELPGHLAQAAVMAAPSRIGRYNIRDGIPTVVVEAWLSHTPVVASLAGGMGEVIIDGETGVVFACEDAEGLADAIGRVLDDHALRARIVDGGYRMARESFSPDTNVRLLLEAIEEKAGAKTAVI